MNILEKILRPCRFLALVACLMASANLFAGTNSFRVEPFSIKPGEEIQVDLLLDNDVPVIDMRIDFDKSEILQVVDFTPNTAETSMLKCQTNNAADFFRVMYSAASLTRPQALPAGSHVMGQLTVKCADGVLGGETVLNVSRHEVADNDPENPDGLQPLFQVPVTIDAPLTAEWLTYKVTPETSFIAPGKSCKVTLSFDSSDPIFSAQMRMRLPEGFKLVQDEAGYPVLDTASFGRVNPSTEAVANYSKNGSFVTISFFNDGEHNAFSENGEVASFQIVAPESFVDDTVNFEFYDVMCTFPEGKDESGNFYDIEAADYTLTLDNAKKDYDRADAAIQALRDELTAALQTIAEECPDVAESFTGEEVSAHIDTLAAAVEAAKADDTIVTNYDEVMAPAADIRAEIEALIAAARVAQNAEDVYKQAQATIQDLRDGLQYAVDFVTEGCPDVIARFSFDEYETAINNLEAAVDAAHEAGTLVENYEEVMAPVEAIQQGIIDLANEIMDAEMLFLDNVDASNADLAALDTLEANLAAKVEELKGKYPNMYRDEQEKEIGLYIENGRKDVADELASAQNEGREYVSPVDIDAIQDQIDSMENNIISGVDSIYTDSETARWFTLQGQQVSAPIRGTIMIKVNKEGKTSKVLVK